MTWLGGVPAIAISPPTSLAHHVNWCRVNGADNMYHVPFPTRPCLQATPASTRSLHPVSAWSVVVAIGALGKLVRIHLPFIPSPALPPTPTAPPSSLGSSCVVIRDIAGNKISATHGAPAVARCTVGVDAKHATKTESATSTALPQLPYMPVLGDDVDPAAKPERSNSSAVPTASPHTPIPLDGMALALVLLFLHVVDKRGLSLINLGGSNTSERHPIDHTPGIVCPSPAAHAPGSFLSSRILLLPTPAS